MYDNQLRALEIIPIIAESEIIPEQFTNMLHRELTRGISIFEDRDNSGKFRTCGVWIGGQAAPEPHIAAKIIYEVLIPNINDMRKRQYTSEEALDFAWYCHHLFECAHPYIDGNGRTGRLLLNAVLEFLGQEKIIIYDNEKRDYYKRIQRFRDFEYPEILKENGIKI
jgi:Fic family protein